MPTSLPTLLRYRAAHAHGCESRRVWLFHSHTYFDHTAPERVAEARVFRGLIQRTFAATATPGGVEKLAILIHPLTRSQMLDHTARALWLGAPLAINRSMLEAVDVRLLASGATEESIIQGTKRH
jgi:aromatic ring-cleaving dioxygenase